MNSNDTAVLIKALASTGSPLTVADAQLPDCPIIYCNDAFLALSGYKREEIIGKNCRFLQGEDTDRREIKKLSHAIEKAEDVSLTILNYTKDGHSFWNDLRISPVVNEKHQVTHFIGFQNDISARLEKERVDLLVEKLENDIELAAVEEERLNRLNKIKDDFISIASHQLRTPVTAVKQYLALLASGMYGELNDQQRKALATAERNNERQLEIIDDLLKVAQLDSNEVILHKRRTDLRLLLQEAALDFAPAAKAHSIAIETSIGLKPVLVPVDPALMRTVVDNLLDNAIKYSGPHSTILVELNATDKEVSFSIQDEGLGIPAEDRERIFTKFARSSFTETKNVNGTGLGLYWVKTVTELHGAQISVDSHVGKGSRFSVTFQGVY